MSLETLAAELAEMDAPLTVLGDGAQLCYNHLTAVGIACTLAPAHLRQQSALGVGFLGEELVRAGRTVSAQTLTPVYLRLSQAERERLARGESLI